MAAFTCVAASFANAGGIAGCKVAATKVAGAAPIATGTPSFEASVAEAGDAGYIANALRTEGIEGILRHFSLLITRIYYFNGKSV